MQLWISSLLYYIIEQVMGPEWSVYLEPLNYIVFYYYKTEEAVHAGT